MKYHLRSKVWLYPGEAAWHFVNVSKKVSREIKETFGGKERGFGSIRVVVTVGKTSWTTSIFPDKKSGTYLLPIKADVRKEKRYRRWHSAFLYFANSCMKQQVVAIHGGTSFDTYEDYIAFIKTRELTLERLKQCEDWKASLPRKLGEAFEVLLPKMPNGTNARYSEWSLWLERCTAFLQDDVILIGHSLGGIFLAKYLAEHSFPKRIKATLLVGAPFGDTSTVESLVDFALPASLQQFEKQGGTIYLIHSKDDPVVPAQEVEQYQRALPQAKQLILDDRGHFNQEEFPELVALIQSL